MRLCARVCHYLGGPHPWFRDRMVHEVPRVFNRREVCMRVHQNIITERIMLLYNYTIHPEGLDVIIWRFWDLLRESGSFLRLPTRNAELRVQSVVCNLGLSDWRPHHISRISLAILFQF